MMTFLYYLAWEWINLAVEYTAVSWVKLPRFFWAVAFVNLVTHPAFVLLLERFGRAPSFVVPCEVVIVGVEFALLLLVYGRAHWRLLLLTAFIMNAVSYTTGLLVVAFGCGF